MDANQKFCLKWNNFQSSVTSVFDNLRQDEELVDITLCCEGKKIKAHRMMLSACSPYFRDLLKENPCQHPIFFLKDTSFIDLAAVVEFVYKGEVNVTQSQLASFLKTAEMLQVRGLAGDDDSPQPPAPQTPSQQQKSQAHQPTRSSSVSAAPGSPSVGRGRPAAAPPEPPAVKRRRISVDGSPDSEPLSADSQPAEFVVKMEQLDADETDAGDGRLEGSYGAAAGYGMASYETVPTSSAAAADVAGFLSSVAEQGGSGNVMLHSTAGPSDEGASQEWRRGPSCPDRPVYRVCRLCQKPLYSPTALSFHMDMHRGRTTCSVCGRVLVSRQKLNLHLQRLHGTSLEELQQQQERRAKQQHGQQPQQQQQRQERQEQPPPPPQQQQQQRQEAASGASALPQEGKLGAD